MHSLNVLVAGEDLFIDWIKSSKYLNKLYVTSEREIDGAFRIKFNTFKELAEKCKTLQIDVVVVENEKWILEGIANVLKKDFVNCIAPTAYWTQLALSNSFAKELMSKYLINTPKEILLPAKFPVLVRADGVLRKADSLKDIVKIKQEIFQKSPEIAKTVRVEEMLEGSKYNVISLFDGKHLLTFPQTNIDSLLLQDFSQKLEKMLVEEKADFIGFINSEIVQVGDKIYNTGFNFKFLKPEVHVDLLYILNSAIYQKLDEIDLRTV